MPNPFEDPRKTDLRGRCAVAVDAAGHELIEKPVRIPLPEKFELQGAILGDIQSVDGEQNRYCYYVRPEGERPLPQWLANLSLAAHEVPGVRVYVVVDKVSGVMERTCRAVGMGLLRLTQENTFEHLIDPTAFDPATLRTRRAERVKELRRRLEARLKLNLGEIEEHFRQVNELTVGMTGEKRDAYIAGVEEKDRLWRDWAEHVSTRLDEAAASDDEDELRVIERMIEQGAVPEDEA